MHNSIIKIIRRKIPRRKSNGRSKKPKRVRRAVAHRNNKPIKNARIFSPFVFNSTLINMVGARGFETTLCRKHRPSVVPKMC